MIEKILRAVKSSSKKRGRNITIGAVVGMLLSCSAVMGADTGKYLWIKGDGGIIKFNTLPTTKEDGADGEWKKENPYDDENSWTGSIYINNITLSGKDNGKGIIIINGREETIGYGLRLSGDLGENFKFINNGIITGTGTGIGHGNGIYNSGAVNSLKNIGIISGTVTRSEIVFCSGNGIYNSSSGTGSTSKIEKLINIGIISGTVTGSAYGNENGNGIYNFSSSTGSISKIEKLINIGIISGAVTVTGSGPGNGIFNYSTDTNTTSKIEKLINNGIVSGSSFGIYNSSFGTDTTSKIENLINSGIISGSSFGINNYSYESGSTSKIEKLINSGIISGSSSGIMNYSSGSDTDKIGNITNTGVIYGRNNAIDNSGKIDNLTNYGIIVAGGNEAISNTNSGTITNNPEHYGLQIKNGGTIEGTSIDTKGKPINVTVGYAEDGTTPLKRSMTIENKNDSSSFSRKKTDSILNALGNTYKVAGTEDKVTGSIINAYGNAVVFESGKKLTLSGTTVNGGIKDDTVAILGSSGNDTLILEGAEVAYKDIDDKFQQTVINGNINMGTGADTLTIGNGTVVNGTLDGGIEAGNDILNFVSSVARIDSSNADNEIRILHNISNFENINVNSNVTFYENTVNADSEMESLKITGAKEIKIGADGVLTLRIDTASGANTHALSSNTGGTIFSENGGKLVLALNGAGESNIIDFGTTGLDMSTFVTRGEGTYKEDVTLDTTSALHSVEAYSEVKSSGILINKLIVTAKADLPMYNLIPEYKKLNEIYHGILSVENLLGNFNVEKDNDKNISLFLSYLNDIYTGNPYSYSSELSRKSAGMFRDIVTENQFKPETNKWMIYGGLTHVDGGTKDTYYGKGYYTYDIGSSDMEADTKITGAYMLGEYGVSDTLTSGVIIGGNKLKSDISNGSKVDGDALYLGAYAKKYLGNLKVTAGAGFQYGDYDIDRMAVNNVASDTEMSVIKYSDNYNDMTYDIYLNGRYSNPIGDNLFLEPYGTLSYTYTKQDGTNEGSKTLTIETDSKSFDYTSAKVGVDLKKVISHEKGKSTLSAGVSYTKILDGAEEEYITGRFKGGSDFDILVAHKNEHSIGLNAKYALELENGILFDVKGTYSVERDSNNNSGKNKSKGEWIAGAGIGYKF